MKIKTILITILLFCSFAAMSQYKGDVRVGAYGQVVLVNNDIIKQCGFVGELFVFDNFSLNYKYGIGVNSAGEISGHINPSLLLLPFFAYNSYEFLLATLLISEGASYHFVLNDFFEVAPYLSPLGAEINMFEDYPFVLSGAVGVNMYFQHATPFNKLSIAPNAGVIVIYRDGTVLPSFGMSISYTFR